MTEGDTATALVDAAEALFATDGIERASLRAVMRKAGTDPGAIHYHFGGRESLAEAVLDRVLVPLNERRLALLDTLEAESSAGPLSMTALVDALVRPDIEAASALEARGSGRARLIGLIYLEPSAFVTEQVRRRFMPVASRFHPHLIRAAPGVAPELLAWRIRWCVFGTLGAVLADPHEPSTNEPALLLDMLVPTLAAAVAASTTPEESP